MPVTGRKKDVRSRVAASRGGIPAGKRKPVARTKESELMPLSEKGTMSSKGQVVIPAELRRKYRLEEGVTVVFREEAGHIVLEPDRFAAFFALRGTLPAEMEEELMEERRKEREHEDRKR